ncbi:MAG: hypothetical protein Q8940_07395 [Bacteroidota bacterium]|nr:hypothetical protein [Bacteroidota bacterium]
MEIDIIESRFNFPENRKEVRNFLIEIINKLLEVKMFLSFLTGMGFYINGAIETNKYDNIGIDEVKKQICQKTIFNFLEERLSDDLDISLWTKEDKSEVSEEWANFAHAIDEKRKLCVESKGLSLIMAYILQSIQLRFRNN